WDTLKLYLIAKHSSVALISEDYISLVYPIRIIDAFVGILVFCLATFFNSFSGRAQSFLLFIRRQVMKAIIVFIFNSDSPKVFQCLLTLTGCCTACWIF